MMASSSYDRRPHRSSYRDGPPEVDEFGRIIKKREDESAYRRRHGDRERDQTKRRRVDRETMCPFLLRCFVRVGGHHRPEEFSVEHVPEQDQVQLHTWHDTTLRELTQLLTTQSPSMFSSINPKTALSFRIFYVDTLSARFHMRDIGLVTVTSNGPDDEKTLEMANFGIGEYIDVCVLIDGERSMERGHERRTERAPSFGGRSGHALPGLGRSGSISNSIPGESAKDDISEQRGGPPPSVHGPYRGGYRPYRSHGPGEHGGGQEEGSYGDQQGQGYHQGDQWGAAGGAPYRGGWRGGRGGGYGFRGGRGRGRGGYY
ncbi:Sin3 associated polypeptide p18-domain-containing protein [Paraphysoderma sedebokerense]|nr:Sin3 associated polypeptide p18-domain-containing protein [Paraphysoderma sedebokerense]